jgi:hypothetical protein
MEERGERVAMVQVWQNLNGPAVLYRHGIETPFLHCLARALGSQAGCTKATHSHRMHSRFGRLDWVQSINGWRQTTIALYGMVSQERLFSFGRWSFSRPAPLNHLQRHLLLPLPFILALTYRSLLSR